MIKKNVSFQEENTKFLAFRPGEIFLNIVASYISSCKQKLRGNFFFAEIATYYVVFLVFSIIIRTFLCTNNCTNKEINI